MSVFSLYLVERGSSRSTGAGLRGTESAKIFARLETATQEPGLLVILKLCRALETTPAKLLADYTSTTIQRMR